MQPNRDAWLDRMPDLLAMAAARWGLRIAGPLEGGSLSCVHACTDADGTKLVLKLLPPHTPSEREAEALRLWNGQGAARLLGHDPAIGALLMERVTPGTSLPPGNDLEAIAEAGTALTVLHSGLIPGRHPFPSLAEYVDEWLERVRRWTEPGTVGVGLLDDARRLAMQLCASATRAVLLHGDFIDKNLLLGPSGYVAIDPIPSIGDPCSDIGFFASYHPPARDITPRARALAARLGHDPDRAERWAFVFAIGGACETWRRDSEELQEWIRSYAGGMGTDNRGRD
jgi:streptomycin 6-kinase